MNIEEVKKIFITGAGFLADAYDLFVINVAVDMMDRNDYHQELTTNTKSLVKTTALIGAVVGQILFGSIADLIGRRKVFIVTCALVICGAILSATAQDSEHFGIYSQIALWRFVLGVGVSGEYPLSAAITSESSSNDRKVQNLATVFSMQGFGSLLCALVLVSVSNSAGYNYDFMWRFSLAFGGLPMILAFYFRWKMHETSAWEKKNPMEDEVSLSSFQYFKEGIKYVYEVVNENFWALVGTAGAWFIIDVVFYANGLFSGQITTAMGLGSSIRAESLSQLILQSLSLPGYLFTIRYVNYVGLSNLQRIGFMATACFFFLLSVLQPYLTKVPPLYIILYGFTFFFQNFGGNATTYIIPSVIYKTHHKATCHGISAAAGKLGAILGALTLLYLSSSFCPGDNCDNVDDDDAKNSGLRVTFAVCGVFSVFGLIWTELFVKDAKVRHDDDSSIHDDSITTKFEMNEEFEKGDNHVISPLH